jgi:hypothetical protein
MQSALRWLARGGSVLVAVLFVGLWWHQPPRLGVLPPKLLAQLLLMTAAVLGLLLGWWRERLGGAIAAVGFVGYLVLEGIARHRFPLIPPLFVMLLPALLYLVVGSPKQSPPDAAA